MPRYFFSATDGVRNRETFEADLENIEEARTAAVLTLAYSIRDAPETVWSSREIGVKVVDESGAVVATVTVSAV